MDELNEWLRRADEANLLTVKEQKSIKEAIATLDLTPLTQYAIADLCDAIYKLGQLNNTNIKPEPDKLSEETKKLLDKQTSEKRLELIKDMCVDWDGYRTAAGLGSLINEIWAYAAYPCNNKAKEIIQFKSKNNNIAQFNKEEIAAQVRHGRWMMTDAYPHKVYCSECYKTFAQTHWTVWEDGSLPRGFCPNCGARMDGGKSIDVGKKASAD